MLPLDHEMRMKKLLGRPKAETKDTGLQPWQLSVVHAFATAGSNGGAHLHPVGGGGGGGSHQHAFGTGGSVGASGGWTNPEVPLEVEIDQLKAKIKDMELSMAALVEQMEELWEAQHEKDGDG